MDAPKIRGGIEIENLHVARRFIAAHHYASKCPPHCLECLGQRDSQGDLQCLAVWGWGVRPRHTIEKIFPSLGTQDYRELCRLCCQDEMPRNSESHLLGLCADWYKKNMPGVKVLLSWADGMRGKPGYVYQSANWLYAGYIETEFYVNASGETLHPRFLITQYGTRANKTLSALGLRKLKGRQFLYLKFLCSHAERKALLRECQKPLSTAYPKSDDCLVYWAEEGSRVTHQSSTLRSAVRFRNSAFQPSLFGDGA